MELTKAKKAAIAHIDNILSNPNICDIVDNSINSIKYIIERTRIGR